MNKSEKEILFVPGSEFDVTMVAKTRIPADAENECRSIQESEGKIFDPMQLFVEMEERDRG